MKLFDRNERTRAYIRENFDEYVPDRLFDIEGRWEKFMVANSDGDNEIVIYSLEGPGDVPAAPYVTTWNEGEWPWE